MHAIPSLDRTRLQSHKLVIPVGTVARGEVLQTTSTAFSPNASMSAPRGSGGRASSWAAALLPRLRETLARSGVVSWVTGGANPGFWAQFSEEDGTTGCRAAGAPAGQRRSGLAPLPRQPRGHAAPRETGAFFAKITTSAGAAGS